MTVVTREQARQAVTAKVEARKQLWTAYPLVVEYDNRETVNTATQSLPYLSVSMVYIDGMQIGLGNLKEHRAVGSILLEACDKVGQGTARMNDLLDFFYRDLQMSDGMGPIRTYAARFSSRPAENGWVAQAAVIPFWFDTE